MTIIPINGKNERMGALFSTPKHLLLFAGVPALKKTLDYMTKFGPIIILAGEAYYDGINVDWLPDDCTVFKVKPTENVVETIKQCKVDFSGSLYIVDCDVVPNQINKPVGNTVYLFENKRELKQYSNYLLADGCIVDCNEKEELSQFAGAGVYYFKEAKKFFSNCEGLSSISGVIQQMILEGHSFFGDTDSDIFRLGTLPDITGGFTGNILKKTITKKAFIRDEIKWYAEYQDKKDIPEIISYDLKDHSLTMEFFQKEGEINIHEIIKLVEKYRHYRPRINNLQFDIYRQRIVRHLQENPIHGADKLNRLLALAWLEPTFCHGDLSTVNIIPTKEGHKLIDPLYSEYIFGSYILDYAKLLFSLNFYANDAYSFNELQQIVKVDPVFIASECVRVATHKKEFNFIAENLINEL